MKIGIVTLFFPEQWDNYGGILQNYALYKKISDLGNSVHTIGFVHSRFPIVFYKMFARFLYRHFGIQVNIKKHKISHIGIQRARDVRFNDFIENNLDLKVKWVINKKLNLNKRYDLFFVGSDQVWNPYWAINRESAYTYFLEFADEHKRISYAASLGANDIPKEAFLLFANGLRHFNKISVRESEAKDIIAKFSNSEVEVVLDPTLLLTKEEWSQIEKKPQKIQVEKPYVLTYFLGDVYLEREQIINGLELSDEYEFFQLNKKEFIDMYILDPAEFIYMIHHASLILTDSFHACVFSFVFEKPFLVFDRVSAEGDMSSRINSLLDMIGLKRKYVNSGLYNDIWEHDYQEGYMQVEIEKKKSMMFIKESIGYGHKDGEGI